MLIKLMAIAVFMHVPIYYYLITRSKILRHDSNKVIKTIVILLDQVIIGVVFCMSFS